MTGPGTPFPLGRVVNHDPQSRQFPFSARPEAAAAVVSVRWTRRSPILDQLELGSCTGNAAAGWLCTDGAGRTGQAGVTEDMAVDFYSAATAIDGLDGQYPPSDTGSDGLSVTKVLQQRGYVESYTHCFSLDEVLTALQSGPVLTGIPWYEGMFYPDDRGVVTISGGMAGGHEVLIDGVDAEREEVVFPNSWGTGWGVNGWGRMSYDTYGRLLSEDGDATVPHPAAAPAPSPEPPPDGAGRTFQLNLPADLASLVEARAARKRLPTEEWMIGRLWKAVGR